ncbi:MAG TPA: phosphoribosylamine--glycine ligase, partial [bacterium]|nr:phosphoribosylamine--glycine ligase [bacterium]
MKVLVIGSGGREHALVQKISKSPAVREVLAVPGNAGIGQQATCFNLKETDFPALVRLAADNRIDLTVVGPEVPLARGIADTFQSSGLKLFGPTARAARLESSKIFAKEFMKRHGIPTADFSVADTISRALQQVEKKGYPVAIKYDGLAAGKGVRVVWNRKEAVSFLEDIFERNIFGSPGPAVVIEEALTGEEVSYLIVTDTLSYHPLAPARDYKRIFDLDQGPNTGGMGAYSPAVLLEGETARFVQEEVVHRTLKALLREGIEYRGVLYFGLMLTKKGVSVLEYNVRFGDPETQVILPRLENDLVELMEATVA